MTPKEAAVINAAIRANGINSLPTYAQQTALREAVLDLIFSCSKCNYEGHVCPGCSEPVNHTQTACADCEAFWVSSPMGEKLLSDPWLSPADNSLDWYRFAYVDVRKGDTIRHNKAAPPAKVLSCSIEDRHVKDGGTSRHWDDTAVKYQLSRVRLDYPGSDPNKILDIPAELPVDILLTPAEARIVSERHATGLERLALRVEEEQLRLEDAS